MNKTFFGNTTPILSVATFIIATGTVALRARENVLSILPHVCLLHLAKMADKPQIVCALAKVDAFIEMANENEMAIMAALAISAASQKPDVFREGEAPAEPPFDSGDRKTSENRQQG